MAMLGKDTLEDLKAMRDEMSRLFELCRLRLVEEPVEDGFWQPPADICEEEGRTVVMMDVPGVAQEDIAVRVEGNRLTITGERRLDPEGSGRSYHRIERCRGPFSRSFFLSSDIDEEGITVACERGVLTIVLPRRGTSSTRRIAASGDGD